MKRNPVIVIVLALSIVSLSSAAFADREEPSRGGFFIGFGLGGGSARPDSDLDYKGGGMGNFRIGYAPADEFTVGLESVAWTSDVDGVTWTFSVGGAGVTFYPGNVGFFGKVGVGVATVEAKVSNITLSDSGFGTIAGAGYEYRITRKFAMGAEMDFAYLNVSSEISSATFFGGNLIFNWYWSQQ